MDIPLTHVIGTIALIGLIITAGLAYTIITSYIEADVNKQQLNQIAEHVALNLVEMVSLVNFANFPSIEPMLKVINLPSDLGEKAYLIKLVMLNETGQSQGYYIQTQLVTRNDITANSPIPLNSTQTRLELKTEEGILNFTRSGNLESIQYNSNVYGGTQEIRDVNGQIIGWRHVVVWGLKFSPDVTWAGIGIWISSGG